MYIFLYTMYLCQSKTSILKRAWFPLLKIQVAVVWSLICEYSFSKAQCTSSFGSNHHSRGCQVWRTDHLQLKQNIRLFTSKKENISLMRRNHVISWVEVHRGVFAACHKWKRVNLWGKWKELCRKSINKKYFHASMLNMISSYNEL